MRRLFFQLERMGRSLAAHNQCQSTCEMWARGHAQTVWEAGRFGKALSSCGSALQGNTREKHLASSLIESLIPALGW